MIPSDVFREVPVLVGEQVRLEPLTEAVLEDYLAAIADPEVRRLTGGSDHHERGTVAHWLATRADHHDRADWAAVRISDGAFVGEAVLNQLDIANASANFRILLAGPHVFGKGHGTEMTRLAVDHGFAVGLHRISLTVFAFNPRARRVYERCGFVVEGRLRDALYQDGSWHDDILMSVLRSDPR